MKEVTLRKDPTHWIGMTVGAIAGLPIGWLVVPQDAKDSFSRGDEYGFMLPLCSFLGLLIGALLGLAIAHWVYRQRDRSLLEEKLFEREIELHHEFAQGTLLFSFVRTCPESTTGELGETTLLTSQFLIKAVMNTKQCQAVCENARRGLHADSGELFATFVLPNAESIRAIPLLEIRSVIAKEDYLSVTTFDEERCRECSSWWTLPEESGKTSAFTWKLKEALGCRNPISRRNISAGKKRIRLLIATIGVVVCWSLVLKGMFAPPRNPWLIVPMILAMFPAVAFSCFVVWIWRDAGELVVFERSRSLKENQIPKRPQALSDSSRNVGINIPRPTETRKVIPNQRKQ